LPEIISKSESIESGREKKLEKFIKECNVQLQYKAKDLVYRPENLYLSW
jgi:hypothetical protein